MAFDTQNDRSGAQGTFILPLHPDPDGLEFSQADRQQVQGVYPGILAGPPSDVSRWNWIPWLHHKKDDSK